MSIIFDQFLCSFKYEWTGKIQKMCEEIAQQELEKINRKANQENRLCRTLHTQTERRTIREYETVLEYQQSGC